MFKNHCDCLKKPVKVVSPQNHHVQKKSNRNYRTRSLQIRSSSSQQQLKCQNSMEFELIKTPLSMTRISFRFLWFLRRKAFSQDKFGLVVVPSYQPLQAIKVSQVVKSFFLGNWTIWIYIVVHALFIEKMSDPTFISLHDRALITWTSLAERWSGK